LRSSGDDDVVQEGTDGAGTPGAAASETKILGSRLDRLETVQENAREGRERADHRSLPNVVIVDASGSAAGGF
jgi:hypothetical protein